MRNLPNVPLSPEEQQRLMGQMYLLMEKQVRSYHKHRHMGENSSVPVELARELMLSMEYTIEQGGGLTGIRDAEAALIMGREQLEAMAKKARSQLELVTATAPAWQTDCRWEALQCLRRYLVSYDPLHLAHYGPDDLFYPLPIPVPDTAQGIHLALFFINVLWLENQIMGVFPDEALEELWNRLPEGTLNQCEQVILNAVGKEILSDGTQKLTFTEAETDRLRDFFSAVPMRETVMDSVESLCRQLDLAQNASDYLCAAAACLVSRIEMAVSNGHIAALFL